MTTLQDEGEYNLQDAWNKACTSFAQTTKADLTAKPKFSIDEVLEQIREKQDEDDEKNEKYKTAKDVISKTLSFVMLLGGIAAEGASMVFAPSGLCFNAIAYLVDTGAKYKRIFSSLIELFRRISDVLERCKIYMRLPATAVDVALRKIINEELVCFVDICALSIKVLKGHKVFIALKVFAFDSDEGVSDQLSRLQTLVERESQMRATLGFESQKISETNIIETREGTKKINTGVDKLLNSEKKREADGAAKRLLAKIDAGLDNPSEVFKASSARLKRLLGDQVQGSGKWLRKEPLYESWASHDPSPLSVFGISGGEGYGKSFLFATVVQHLQEVHSEATDEMTYTSIAYYIFDQDKKHTSLVQALKVLAWQVVNMDVVYRKDLSSVSATGINQISSLWDLLFSKSYKSDSTFYLLLDGVDMVDKPELRDFIHVLGELQTASAAWQRFKLRILLSGRVETMSKIQAYMDEGISIIDVASKNSDDMERFIIDRMNKMEILSGPSPSAQVVSLRREILENLTIQTHGDFVNVGLLLHEISGKQRPGEIRDILSRSGGKRSDTIARKIERLNETLSEEDIADLNILLTWVIFGCWTFSLAGLESVLFFKTGESSLRPLAEKITDHYASLLQIKGTAHPETKMMSPNSHVLLVSESIKEYLRDKPEKDETEDPQDLDLTDISEAEVRIVRRFLESVCDPQLFSKFGFEGFFQRKLKGNTSRVDIDPDTAHLRILMTCLKVLNSPTSPETAILFGYASVYFVDHLREADPSLTQPEHKTALGPELVNLFTDENIIKVWWNPSSDWFRAWWVYDDSHAEVVTKWLQDSAVSRNLTEDQSKWVKSLSSKSELDADIIEHLVKHAARVWLQDGAGTIDLANDFAVVHGYISKIENRKNPKVKRWTTDPTADTIEASQILAAAEWARQQLKLDSLGYEETRNLARTFREFGKHDEATEYFKRASSLQDYNWFSQWGLATCYAYQKNWKLAIETLEGAKNTIKNGHNKKDQQQLPQLERDLARYIGEAGDSMKAFEMFEALLQENPRDHNASLEMVLRYHKDKNPEGLLKFLGSLKNSTDDATGVDRCTQTFHVHSRTDDYHKALIDLAYEPKTFDAIFEGYQSAIVIAKKKVAESTKSGDPDEMFHRLDQATLTHHFAILCYEHGSENVERKELAIDQWINVLQLEELDDPYYLDILKQSVRDRLARVYFKEACKDPGSADTWLEKLEELASFDPTSTYSDGDTGTWPIELVARYHALQGDEQKAIAALRTRVKHNMDILSDEDPLNDWQGYHALARYFMFAGQDADALAAWSLITPFADADEADGHTEPLEAEQPPKELSGPLLDGCDGQCGTAWTFADDIYMCRECDYTEFDLRCLNKLREGTLKTNICDKDHDMLHVPAYDVAERQRIGHDNVLVGEEIVLVSEWIQRIKEKWGLE